MIMLNPKKDSSEFIKYKNISVSPFVDLLFYEFKKIIITDGNILLSKFVFLKLDFYKYTFKDK